MTTRYPRFLRRGGSLILGRIKTISSFLPISRFNLHLTAFQNNPGYKIRSIYYDKLYLSALLRSFGFNTSPLAAFCHPGLDPGSSKITK
jgi:hypothetical protein